MSSRKWQKGEGKAGCIFWILLFGIGGLVAFRMVPPQIAHMELKDKIEDMAKFQPRQSGEWFEKEILNQAHQLNIPLEKKDLKVEKSLRHVHVELKYVVVYDFIVTKVEKSFEHQLEREIFIM